jgi:hypothetical protein
VGVGVALWRIRPRYIEAVQRRVEGIDASGTFEGEERVLGEAIKSPSPEQALRAADLLERTDLLQETHIALLLRHPQERVQEQRGRAALGGHGEQDGHELDGHAGFKGVWHARRRRLFASTRRWI